MKRFRSISLVVTFLLSFTVFSNWAHFADTGTIDSPLLEYMVLTAALASLLAWLYYCFSKSIFKYTKAHLLALMVFLVIMFSLEVSELVVYATGRYSLGFGSSGNELYHSPNKVPHSGWSQTYSPNRVYNWVTPEFKVIFWVNSLGYRDEEWCHNSNDIRVMSLGDSFTEGVGAEISWVKHLEKSLEDKGVKVQSMNAGISSSDIVYDLYKMEHDLLQYRPDIVLLSINNTDVSNIMGRGCTERFVDENGLRSVRYRDAPSWEYLYGISHFFRAMSELIGLRLERWSIEELDTAYACFAQQLAAFRQLSEDHGFELVVVFHPLDNDVLRRHYGDLKSVQDIAASQGLHTIDLLPYYLNEVRMDASNIDSFYWPIDRHQKSYKVFADGVLNELGYEYFNSSTVSHTKY